MTGPYRHLPLRAKLALWVSGGVAALVVASMLAMLLTLQHEMTHSVAQVQAALIGGIARDLDGKLGLRLSLLQQSVKPLGGRIALREGAEVDAFFADRLVLQQSFDVLALAAADGTIVFSTVLKTGEPRPPMTDRAYFHEVMRTGKPVVTPPLLSRIGSRPVVSFAVPVKDASGRATGVLVGLVRLDRPNFISEIGSLRIGDAGYFTLSTRDEAPIVIAHPKPERLMQPLANRGDPAWRKSTSTGVATTEGVNADGTPVLFTRQALAAVPWVLEAAYPTQEAYAGLRQRQREVLAAGAAVAVVSWVMVWILMTRLLAPLEKLRRALELDASGTDDPLHAIEADSADLAALITAYYAQKRERQATQSALDASERRLRDVANNMPAFVAYLDRDAVYRYVNDRYQKVLGIEPSRMIGRTIAAGLNDDVWRSVAPHVEAVLAGEAQNFEHQVAGHPQIEHLLVTYVPDVDPQGQVVGFYATTLDITARKKAELRLALGERRLKSITDTLPAMVAWVDRSQTYRFANARFEPMMGMAPEAVVGRTMSEFLGRKAHAEVAPQIEAALAGEHRKFEQTGWRRPDTHYLVEYVPEREADGTVAGFLVMVLDISERRRIELALARSEQRLRDIADNVPAIVSHFDRDLRFTFANAEVGRIFRRDPAGLLGTPVLDLIRGEGEAWMRRALAGETVVFELARRDHDDQPQVFDATYVPDVDAAGEVVGFYALLIEITQRKRAEADLKASQQLLDRAGRVAGVGGWELELASAAVSWTSQTRRIHEVADGFVPTVTNAIGFYADAGRTAIDRAVLECMEHGTPWDLVLPLQTAKGRSIWVRSTGEAELEHGRPVRLFGAFQDVTQRVDHERRLREQTELLQVTLKSIGDGVITFDVHGTVQWLNPVAERLTGWTTETARGRPSHQVFHVIHGETRTPAPDPVSLCLRTLGAAGLPSRSVLVALDGQEFAIEDSAAPIRDEFGIVRGAVLVFHDVSEQRRMNDQMAHRATHDELTGLVNRAEFESRLTRVFAKAREGGPGGAVMYIDLDHFKRVNDACGHAMGDKLLCQVSDLMRASVRARDTLARLGGDEFGVLLEHCTVEQAQRVAQSICDRMEEFRFVHDGRRFRIGASIGLAPVDERWPTQTALLHAADSACFAAKEEGRNRVHVWYDSDAATRDRQGDTQWGSRLEEALDDDGFMLFGQRIEATRNPGAGLHFEVLLRLRESDGAIVEPGRFLPAAERFHMASRIDRWVVRRVFDWLVEAEATAPDAIETVAINLSGQSIGDRAFHRYVVELLQQVPVDPTKLCFEVTETAAITNLADATAFIQAMRSLGMRVALDDFGAGASSFGYLKNLPVDYLKIDGQFIRNIEQDPLDMAAVRCFHEVARAIGVQTVAEYVETASIRTVLDEIGIDYLQGYLLHRPEPIDDLLRRATAGGKALAVRQLV